MRPHHLLKGKPVEPLPGLCPSPAGGQHSLGLILELSDIHTHLPPAQRALLMHPIHTLGRVCPSFLAGFLLRDFK